MIGVLHICTLSEHWPIVRLHSYMRTPELLMVWSKDWRASTTFSTTYLGTPSTQRLDQLQVYLGMRGTFLLEWDLVVCLSLFRTLFGMRLELHQRMQGRLYPMLHILCLLLRVTGYTFNKDIVHEAYRGEKTHHTGVGETIPHHKGAVAADIPESSCSASHNGKKGKIAKWIKAIFSTCTYAANTAYEA